MNFLSRFERPITWHQTFQKRHIKAVKKIHGKNPVYSVWWRGGDEYVYPGECKKLKPLWKAFRPGRRIPLTNLKAFLPTVSSCKTAAPDRYFLSAVLPSWCLTKERCEGAFKFIVPSPSPAFYDLRYKIVIQMVKQNILTFHWDMQSTNQIYMAEVRSLFLLVLVQFLPEKGQIPRTNTKHPRHYERMDLILQQQERWEFFYLLE